jgi:hypothetical protein
MLSISHWRAGKFLVAEVVGKLIGYTLTKRNMRTLCLKKLMLNYRLYFNEKTERAWTFNPLYFADYILFLRTIDSFLHKPNIFKFGRELRNDIINLPLCNMFPQDP